MGVSSARRKSLVMLAGFEGSLVVLAYALGWLTGIDPGTSVAFSAQGWLWGILATLPMLLLLWGVHLCRHWEPLARIEQIIDEILVPLIRPCHWGDLVLVSLLAGIGEELLFRGWLQQALATWLNPWLAMVLVSIAFGWAHYVTRAYAIATVFIGAYLGTLALVFDNLLIPIVAHALYDAIALILLHRETSKRHLVDPVEHFEGELPSDDSHSDEVEDRP